ncbi:hypothetical protein [Mesorhizobium sp. M1B.F.Ca.ET.045.04.1.1]|uniref:hypothetical protein n=1 Tax=Mesorhizobium sp. M1B.F.Ca.ET.045.04.1.1 TaxID=2493673 RepID=UPI000F74F441|nr:hypothetical protein [Mesorhizobium sp. M1B.F.Ca.ET.045.04.1.1]AZO29295.1 hypothetical protein EJ071_19200 [Mesorhizobium sp. M1B.F.Ca.ET.045.04.1.1]
MNSALIAALRECIETLSLVEHPPRVDSVHGDAVRELGSRIGYGALMSSASASWRAALAERGLPAGGEFVAGPCHGTVERTLKLAREVMAVAEAPDEPIDAEGWQPIDSAPKIDDQRILAWCTAAESLHGIIEMIWRGKRWAPVIEHPWTNACLAPTHWRPTFDDPKARS